MTRKLDVGDDISLSEQNSQFHNFTLRCEIIIGVAVDAPLGSTKLSNSIATRCMIINQLGVLNRLS